MHQTMTSLDTPAGAIEEPCPCCSADHDDVLGWALCDGCGLVVCEGCLTDLGAAGVLCASCNNDDEED